WGNSVACQRATAFTFGIFGQVDTAHRGAQAVEKLQLPGRIIAKAGDDANGFHRGKTSHQADHRAEHADFRTIIAIIGVQSVADKTAIAGLVILPPAENAKLPLKLAYRCGYQRDAVGERKVRYE